jgi:hypothetical protein
MADINIQMKNKNGSGWDDLYPKTKPENVIGLDTVLGEKVDKITGKGLSTEDYTTAEKTKLTGIATGAQVNRTIATQAQAEAGTDNATDMTPLRVAQAIAALAPGGGGGDMLKTVYDTNNNGKVDVAEAAEAVPWAGVSGKPTTFTPAAHAHSGADITTGTVAAARLPAASVSAAGIAQLNNTTASTSTTQAATANAVKLAYDEATSKSKIVVSATAPSNADIWYQEV